MLILICKLIAGWQGEIFSIAGNTRRTSSRHGINLSLSFNNVEISSNHRLPFACFTNITCFLRDPSSADRITLINYFAWLVQPKWNAFVTVPCWARWLTRLPSCCPFNYLSSWLKQSCRRFCVLGKLMRIVSWSSDFKLQWNRSSVTNKGKKIISLARTVLVICMTVKNDLDVRHR